MPRICSICSSPYAKKVNDDLAEGIPIREIAKRYGLSHPAIARHKLNCVAGEQARKLAKDATERGVDVALASREEPGAVIAPRLSASPDAYSELASLKNILSSILNQAVISRDSDLVVAASRELRSTTETMLKVWETQKRIEAQYEKASPLSATWVYGWMKTHHPELAAELVQALREASR